MNRHPAVLLAGVLLVGCASEECLTRSPTADEDARIARDVAELSPRAREPQASETATVTIHAWIIDRSDGTGKVPTSTVSGYLNDLVAAYQGMKPAVPGSAVTRFRFGIGSVSRYTSDAWSYVEYDNDPDAEQWAMRRQLRRKGRDVLNVWITDLPKGTNGWASFPWKNPDTDGVLIDKAARYSTYVHEAGHWLGLLHTFERHNYPNGCSGPGDRVSDTPAEAKGCRCCRLVKDTCPAIAGKDPTTNYMTYATCRERFTSGQSLLAWGYWKRYRAPGHPAFTPLAGPEPIGN